MHRIRYFYLSTVGRGHATYGAMTLTHDLMRDRFSKQGGNVADELNLLSCVEERIAKWKLNKWEFRIPPLVQVEEKEKLMLQRDMLKSLCLDQSRQLEAIRQDLNLVTSITGVPAESVREKNRAWLQEEAGKLRWKGEVNKAKELRDAFLRLEIYGSKDFRILQRLCCIYGLGMLGTFEEAFSNTVVADPVSNKLSVDEGNPFTQLLSHIVCTYPHIDLIYDFLGFNPVNGYRRSLARFLTELLEKKNDVDASQFSGRVLFSNPTTKEVLFDATDSSKSITSDDSVYGLPDFLYINGSDLFLITIASSNHWLRNRQLPHSKQLEGIGRRASFIFGVPFDKIRVKNVLLPPQYLDASSLKRLTDVVLGLSPEEQKKFAPWIALYDKELDPSDVDFAELTKTVNEEEWLTL